VKDHDDEKKNYERIGIENHDVGYLKVEGIKMI